MSIAKWSEPAARSSNILGSVADSLADNSESAVVTYDNSSGRNLYGAVCVKLGSIDPNTSPSITLRVTVDDGTDTGDRVSGDTYVSALTTGESAKVVVFPMVRLYPFSLRFSILNNAGTALAGSGNELYVRAYNEEVD